MSSHLIALGNRARTITALAALLAAAMLMPVPAPARAASGPTTQLLGEGAGMAGEPSARVRTVQRRLHRRGYDLGPSGIDGRFGPWTATAVRGMQGHHALVVDGIVGDHTRDALGLSSHDARRSQARSAARHEADPAPVSNRRAPRSIAPRAPGRNMSSLELGNGSTEPSVAAAIVGALSGAMATMLLGLQRSRRRRRGSVNRVRGPRGPENRKPPGKDQDPDAWTASVPRDDDTAGPPPAIAADREGSQSGLARGCPVIGYVTVSGDLGSGETVRSSSVIEARCRRADWNLLEIVGDRENGRTLERPGLGYALGRIADGHARGLVVNDLQRLSRSIVDLGALMAWLRDAGATLIALDLGIDTSTAEGDHVATTLIALSVRAHERIADRTRDRLAERRANGGSNGRPAVRDRPELMKLIATMRARGMTLQEIADRLNATNVPTVRGGRRWRPSSIQAALGYRRPSPQDHLPRLTRDRP